MEKFYLYNTLTKRVDEFVPREAGKVSMYTCGPTVYRFAHIGNLRSYIMEAIAALEIGAVRIMPITTETMMPIGIGFR